MRGWTDGDYGDNFSRSDKTGQTDDWLQISVEILFKINW